MNVTSVVTAEPVSEPVTGALLMRLARAYLGTPFIYQGVTRAGVCCGGLFVAVAKEAALIPAEFEMPLYPAIPRRDNFQPFLDAFCDEVPLPEMRAGDLVLLNIPWTEAWHLAMRTDLADGRPGLLHAYPGTRVNRVAEHGIDGKWNRLIKAVYRFQGLTG